MKNRDTLKDHTIIPTGSTVAIEKDDRRPEMHGTVT